MKTTKPDAEFTEEVEAQEGMTQVKEICGRAIRKRIDEGQQLINSAISCLTDGDYHQAAVRLELLKSVASFTETEFSIFDSASHEE